MKIYVGVTDNNWFKYLASIAPNEVNFWRPGDRTRFRALEPNDLFLFKLHSPLNYIVGGGFFVKHSFLPVSLAWETFGNKNGAIDYDTFANSIYKYRKTNRRNEPDPVIGCIILTSPFFFPREHWIPVPEDWKPNIVQGKTYDTSDFIGRKLYKDVVQRMQLGENMQEQPSMYKTERFGRETLIKPRLGQGAFRVMVTDAYHRRCAITGEKTLPALDATHIKPYSMNGPHMTNNGLLLRKDLHALYDRGYITITEDNHIEVSKRIKEDYGNGREYYAMHGQELSILPDNAKDRPKKEFIRWHNEKIYLG